AEIEDARTGRNGDLRGRTDRRDAVALDQHHLVVQERAAHAVEQASGANSNQLRRIRTFVGAAIDPEASRGARSPPGLSGSADLLRAGKRGQQAPGQGESDIACTHDAPT